jgi:hypothetical protein
MVENILNDLKTKGIECALVRKDGVLVYSTLTLDEATPDIIASLSAVSEELMMRTNDRQKEIEVSLGGIFFVMVPFKEFILCGAVKDREMKKDLRAAVDLLKQETIE